jgi:hypothetical protein
MREYLVKTKRAGGAVVIELPKELLQAEQIGADMTLKITIQKYQKPVAIRAKMEGSLGPDDPWKLLE